METVKINQGIGVKHVVQLKKANAGTPDECWMDFNTQPGSGGYRNSVLEESILTAVANA